ncbi:type VI secretion system tip protein VgrG [Methylomonas sp. AM2-LC]|uniref:type VI secretion system Vgr family protein n=1 Tax=Methylomonas sp. AM2-LC TaxID=3153301 RepID=UPI003263C90E
MAYTQDNRMASVTFTGISDTLLLYRITGSEQFSRLFEYELELLSENGSVDLKSMLGKSATIKLYLAEGGERDFNGIVTQVNQYGMLGNLYYYRAVVHPKLWLLTRTSNCKVQSPQIVEGAVKTFTVPDLVKNVLSAYGYTDITTQFTTTYQPREFCVQYRETDFNFISRLLEEEGIYYYFTHTDSTHTLVLCDNMDAHQDTSGNATIKYYPMDNQQRRDEEHIYDWSLSQQIQSGKYTLNDFDFENPGSDLKGDSVTALTYTDNDKEVYDYPGEYKAVADGKSYAKIRMEEQDVGFQQVTARGNIRRLATGSKFTLTEFPREDQNSKYLVVSTHFQFQNNSYSTYGTQDSGEDYQCSYTVISASSVYRPPRISPVPVVQGVQTATVVGAKGTTVVGGDDITTDKYGRVKIKFHWDRLGTNDQDTYCWVRVAQIWAGKNWGGVFIPRIGQEVIVDFLEGNPDCPIITGSVYNNEQMPPYGLDANKTQSGIKTQSTPNGSTDNYNEIRFEDKKDSEEIFIQAEKDFNCVIENNETRKVGFIKKSAGDQTVEIYNNRTVSLEQGNDSLTVKKGDRTVDVSAGKISETAAKSINLKVGQNTIVMDTSSITLTVGQSSIKMDASSVTIKSMQVSIKGQVSAELKGTMTNVGDSETTTNVKGAMVMVN